jgi:hypothetical protein
MTAVLLVAKSSASGVPPPWADAAGTATASVASAPTSVRIAG